MTKFTQLLSEQEENEDEDELDYKGPLLDNSVSNSWSIKDIVKNCWNSLLIKLKYANYNSKSYSDTTQL
jgi:hypothetical protein